MKPGDIGFIIHKDNWISKAIAWFMGSKWSHTFLVIDQSSKLTYTAETSDFEVTIGTVELYKLDPNVEMEIWTNDLMSEDEKQQSAAHAYKLYGMNYGYLQLISLGIRRLLMRVGIKIKNFFRFGIVCTAVPLEGMRHIKASGLYGIDPESIDTEELYQKIKKSNKWRKVYTK